MRAPLTALAIAVATLSPLVASAGQVWTDGNYYSACPDQIVATVSAEKLPQNGWTKDFNGGGGWLESFSGARVDQNQRVMYCDYRLFGGTFTLTQMFPAGYAACYAYSGIWFVCYR